MDHPDVFDAVVIGGGPAGSAAAFTLASNGLKTCLVDKSAFPREKLCGGLITPRSKRVYENVFGRPCDEALLLGSSMIQFKSNARLLAEVIDHTVMYFTMRVNFDAHLLELARGAGTSLKLQTKVAEIDPGNGSLRLETGETIRFRHLVGADGVNSQVARSLYGAPFNPRTIGFGLEVEVPRADAPGLANQVEIDIGAARWGYGWTFPKRNTFTMGVGGIHRLNPDLKERLARYLSSHALDVANYRVKGQYIPFGDFRAKPARGNVLLCGDAAGAVDAITGEGIAYAMQTGQAAGLAVAQARKLGNDAAAAGLYLSKFEQVSHMIRQSRRWRYIIFPRWVNDAFAAALPGAGILQRGYLDILSGRHDYDALPAIFKAQLRVAAARRGRAALSRLGLAKLL